MKGLLLAVLMCTILTIEAMDLRLKRVWSTSAPGSEKPTGGFGSEKPTGGSGSEEPTTGWRPSRRPTTGEYLSKLYHVFPQECIEHEERANMEYRKAIACANEHSTEEEKGAQEFVELLFKDLFGVVEKEKPKIEKFENNHEILP